MYVGYDHEDIYAEEEQNEGTGELTELDRDLAFEELIMGEHKPSLIHSLTH